MKITTILATLLLTSTAFAGGLFDNFDLGRVIQDKFEQELSAPNYSCVYQAPHKPIWDDKYPYEGTGQNIESAKAEAVTKCMQNSWISGKSACQSYQNDENVMRCSAGAIENLKKQIGL